MLVKDKNMYIFKNAWISISRNKGSSNRDKISDMKDKFSNMAGRLAPKRIITLMFLQSHYNFTQTKKEPFGSNYYCGSLWLTHYRYG